MKDFKRVFLAAALLSSVPALTFFAPSAGAQQQVVPACASTLPEPTCWHVLAQVVTGSDTRFRSVAQCDTRALAQAVVEADREISYLTAVHAVPARAFAAQVAAGVVEVQSPYCAVAPESM